MTFAYAFTHCTPLFTHRFVNIRTPRRGFLPAVNWLCSRLGRWKGWGAKRGNGGLPPEAPRPQAGGGRSSRGESRGDGRGGQPRERRRSMDQLHLLGVGEGRWGPRCAPPPGKCIPLHPCPKLHLPHRSPLEIHWQQPPKKNKWHYFVVSQWNQRRVRVSGLQVVDHVFFNRAVVASMQCVVPWFHCTVIFIRSSSSGGGIIMEKSSELCWRFAKANLVDGGRAPTVYSEILEFLENTGNFRKFHGCHSTLRICVQSAHRDFAKFSYGM
jgi:hypothetical protein